MEPLSVILEWSKTPLGSHLHRDIKRLFEGQLSNKPGAYLLNVGLPDTNEFLERINIPFKWSVTEGSADPLYNDVLATLDALPFPDKMFNFIILTYPGFGNVETKAHFEELMRVLRDNGTLLVLDINPWSPLAWQFKAFLKQRSFKYHFNTVHSMCRKLKQMGMRIDDYENFFYTLPIQNEKLVGRTSFIEALGRLLLLWPSGSYLISARKINYNLVPINAAWASSIQGTEELELIS